MKQSGAAAYNRFALQAPGKCKSRRKAQALRDRILILVTHSQVKRKSRMQTPIVLYETGSLKLSEAGARFACSNRELACPTAELTNPGRRKTLALKKNGSTIGFD